jgi:hypothetical protein
MRNEWDCSLKRTCRRRDAAMVGDFSRAGTLPKLHSSDHLSHDTLNSRCTGSRLVYLVNLDRI